MWRLLTYLTCCAVLFVIYCVGKWAYVSARNYQGYCSGEGARYSRNLTTEERLDRAVADYIQNQILIDFNEIEVAENGGRRQGGYMDALERRFTRIPYTNKAEFYQVNPACCERVWSTVEGEQFGFRERAAGAGNGMFVFKYKVRYKNREGVAKEVGSTNTYMIVNNCGYPTYRFYY